MWLCGGDEAEENLGTVKGWGGSLVLVEEFFSPLVIRLGQEEWEAKFDLERFVCTHPALSTRKKLGLRAAFSAKLSARGRPNDNFLSQLFF